MSNSGLEVSFPVAVIEPNSKLAVSDSWTAKVVKLGDFDIVGEKMRSGVCGYGCPKTMTSDST